MIERIRRLRLLLLQSPAYAWAGLMLAILIGSLSLASLPVPIPGTRMMQEADVTFERDGQIIRKRVPLPHVWDDEQPAWEGQARYRLAWPDGLDQKAFGSEQLGLLLPRVGARFRVYLNGNDIYHQGWDRAGNLDTAAVPHLVRLPTPLLAAEPAGNVLEIEVRGAPLRRSGLSPLQLGPVHGLLARHELVTWWQVQGTWMVASCALMLALMSLSMWLHTRERMFVLLSIASFAWTVRLVLTPIIHSPLPLAWWFYVHKLSFTLYCGFMYLFFWDLFDYRQGLVRSWVKGLLAVAPVWLAYTVYTQKHVLYSVWSAIMLLTAVVALFKVFHQARWGRNADQRFMLVVGVAILATGARDFGVVHLGWPGDADIRWMTAGSFALMFSLGWVLVRRTSDAMDEVRQLNAELAQKVNAREQELQRVFEQLRVVERQRVLEAERRRLTRDMHDGLGSQLVQALNVVRGSGAQVDRSAVATMLNHALEDLRMTLDSLEPMDGDLTTILGTLRQRIAPALEAAGIELDWQVQEVPVIPGLEARGVLHVFRCLQEVFANVLKHAHARQVVVTTRETGGQVELCVRDDGVGLGQTGQSRVQRSGRGMSNIRLRAVELGVVVSFDDARPGTCVRFLFPLHPAERAPDPAMAKSERITGVSGILEENSRLTS